jgi:hypothetical protein
MPFVKIGETHWNIESIARVAKVSNPTELGWASWVEGVITLVSGKEMGLSREDYDALVTIIFDLGEPEHPSQPPLGAGTE